MSEDQRDAIEQAGLPEEVKKIHRAYFDTFESQQGKIVLEDLKRLAFYNTTTINEMPHIMAFSEGQRAVVLHIINRMRLDDDIRLGTKEGE